MQRKQVLPKQLTPELQQKIEDILQLTREFFDRCSAVQFLETQNEMLSCYVLMEHQRLANDMGHFPDTIADELHRSHEQSLFLLRLEKAFTEITN